MATVIWTGIGRLMAAVRANGRRLRAEPSAGLALAIAWQFVAARIAHLWGLDVKVASELDGAELQPAESRTRLRLGGGHSMHLGCI